MTLPLRAQLDRVLTGLVSALPEQLPVLLAHPVLQDEGQALARLAAPERRAEALSALSDREARWLLGELTRLWERIGQVVLPPVCAVMGPTRVWLTESSATLHLRAVAEGLEPGWRASWTHAGRDTDGVDWHGTVAPDSPPLDLLLSVMGRVNGRRVLLDARHRVEVLRPRVLIRAEGRLLRVLDQHGRGAARVRVTLADQPHQTDANGVLVLDEALAPGVPLRVEGARISPQGIQTKRS